MAVSILIKRAGRSDTEMDPSAPWSAREQVDWEQYFKASFVTVFQAVGKDMAASAAAPLKAAGNADGSVDDLEMLDDLPQVSFQVTWMLFFAWHRLRASGDAPAKFDVFLNDVDYEFVRQPNPEPPAEDAQAAQAAVEPSEAVAEQDGSLGPTQTIPEPVPALLAALVARYGSAAGLVAGLWVDLRLEPDVTLSLEPAILHATCGLLEARKAHADGQAKRQAFERDMAAARDMHAVLHRNGSN